MPTIASRARRAAAMAVAVIAASLLAATALAAPAREGSVSSAAPVFAWEGGPGNGSGQGVAAIRCTPGAYECEDTLVEVKNPGDLFAEIKGGDGANDLDVAIYKSDAEGTTNSEPNADSPDAEDVSTGKDAKTTLKKVTPGFYVVRVRIFDGVQAKWTGSATLKGAPAPAQPTTSPGTPTMQPSPTTQPAPQQSAPAKKTKPSAKERRNACKKKAKKIKNKRKRAKAMKRCKKIR